MNPDRSLYGRITLNGNRSSLGFADFQTLLIRASREFLKAKARGDYLIHMEISSEKLPDHTTYNRIEQLEVESAGLYMDDSDLDSEAFPGVTIRRMLEVYDSEEYQQYCEACDPEKRGWMSPELVKQFKQDYFDQFPDCAPHFPLWRDS